MNTREILSFALAISITGLGIYVMDVSLNTPKQKPVTTAVPAILDSEPDSSFDPHHLPQTQIVKCVINGRTIYSDSTCAGSGEVVDIRDTAGIDGDRLTPTKLATLAASENRRREEAQRVTSIKTPMSSRIDCVTIKDRIDNIDAQARQPQSPSRQDWLKEEKMRLQQYAC